MLLYNIKLVFEPPGYMPDSIKKKPKPYNISSTGSTGSYSWRPISRQLRTERVPAMACFDMPGRLGLALASGAGYLLSVTYIDDRTLP